MFCFCTLELLAGWVFLAEFSSQEWRGLPQPALKTVLVQDAPFLGLSTKKPGPSSEGFASNLTCLARTRRKLQGWSQHTSPPCTHFAKTSPSVCFAFCGGPHVPPPPRAGSPTGAAAKALAACQAYDSAAWAAMCANLRSVRSVTEGPCSLPPRAEWESWSLWVGGGRVQPVVTHLPGRGRPPPGLPLRACCHRMLRRWPLQLTPRPTPCEGHD